MSLLFSNNDERTFEIARAVYQKHFMKDPNLEKEYDDRRKKIMYDDIIINLGYLNTAIELNDNKVFPEYAVWIYRLLCSLMKDLSKKRIKDQMVDHYNILSETLFEFLDQEQFSKVKTHIENAIKVTEKASELDDDVSRVFSEKHLDIKNEYLKKLLNTDTRGAIKVIEEAFKSGIPLEEIYVDILQEVMCEIGEMWHKNIITVDKEHYCTSTTQTALSMFYPIIFNKERNGHKIIACCVGSELHEMGMRMIADLFEFNGWDSIYLGAGVPINAVISSIKENKPDVVAFSVTMPQHLTLCLEYVENIKKQFPDVKMAVGGRAFEMTNDLWKKWDIDVYAENASKVITWANKCIERR